jgi:hypothetical protein
MILMSNRKLKRIFIIFIYFLISITFYNIIFEYLTNYNYLLKKIKSKNLKSIQLLTGRFHFVNWKLEHDLGEVPFEKCAEKRCFAFRSILQSPSAKADGIMVHGPNLWYMPSRTRYKRDPKQLWLYYTLESQGRTHCSSHYESTELDDWFNITATFKSDSDLVADYKEFRNLNDIESNDKYIGQFKLLNDPIGSINDLSHKNEQVTVGWYVSHCGTQSRREEYVKEMQKHIKVDIYGNCGTKIDPCNNLKDSKLKEECFYQVINSYKFYLSFENALCQDYVSEKYWQFYDSNKLFKINTLPIVRGAQSAYYRDRSPPHSFIDAQQFKSAKDLSLYLNYLNRNKTAYMEYFKWKIDYYNQLMSRLNNNNITIVQDDWNMSTEYHLREPFCKLCALLHDETYLNSKKNKIWKLSEWFAKKTNCWDQEEPNYIFDKFIKFVGFCI